MNLNDVDRHRFPWSNRFLHPVLIAALACMTTGCRTAAWHRAEADRRAADRITAAQSAALGKNEPIEIETAEIQLRQRLLHDQHLVSRTVLSPDEIANSGRDTTPPPDPVILSPETALQIAARNSREFQQAKESLFKVALDLDLEQNAFRRTFSAMLTGAYDHDRSGEETVSATRGSAVTGVKRQFQNGTELSGSIAVDLVKLLTQSASSSLGLLADASISIPLLRGAGRDIAAEPLRQAEQNLLYAVYTFERFKHTFAVRVFSDYIGVLQATQQIRNAEQNYRSLITASRRARRLADAGRLPEFQYDQSVQNELRARTRWIESRENFTARLDRLKLQIGLPPDARVELDPEILARIHAETRAGDPIATEAPTATSADAVIELTLPQDATDDALQLDYDGAIAIALDMRLDLRIALARVADAVRKITVAEDALRAELTVFGSARTGERRTGASGADSDDVELRLSRLRSNALLTLDLPLNRTAERNAYRRSIIALEERMRDAQEVEDQIKFDIRSAFRSLRLARENLLIQRAAVKLAEKRVHSTDMLLQAGRAQIRDGLEAQESLISAQNALTAAAVSHRIASLEFQRDLGVLDVSADGILQVKALLAEVANPKESP